MHAARCGFDVFPTVRVGPGLRNEETLRCGWVRFFDSVNATVRFGAVMRPTVRFGAVVKIRNPTAGFCAVFKNPTRYMLRCGSVS